MKRLISLALMVLLSSALFAQDLYESGMYVSSQGDTLKYRLLSPESAAAAAYRFILILFTTK